MADLPPPAECANCGAPIPRGAKACPECGADENSGWRETSVYDGLDLPDTDDADEREFPREPARINGIKWYWWLVGLTLIILLIAGRWLL
jgi:hypothetical protein